MTYLYEVTVGGNVVEYADNFRDERRRSRWHVW